AARAKPLAVAPNKEAVSMLLEATLKYDADAMGKILDAMDAYQYQNAPNLIAELREAATNFRYDEVQARAMELLK
ncbi:MAG: hypothetical protein LBR39_01780, partial [Coriobacteriales bacterium]|nr:hypothetical protein [Coriobacteriales bacterium]